MKKKPMEILYRNIGLIHTPFSETSGMPIQPSGAKGVKGEVHVFPEFAEGIADLEGFSHIILIYHLHNAGEPKLTVTPFMDDTPRGVFSTRAPSRPNSIGLSVVKLTGIKGNVLRVENVDVLDETPLLDIKPYVPDFDACESPKTGWLQKNSDKARRTKADDRFS